MAQTGSPLYWNARLRAELVVQKILMLGFVWIVWDWSMALITFVVWFAATNLLAGEIYRSTMVDLAEAHAAECREEKEETDEQP